MVRAITGLKLKYPPVTPEKMKALVAARKELEGEGRRKAAKKAKPAAKAETKLLSQT